MTPVFTIAISIVFLSKRYSFMTYLSLLPLLLGVYMATVGDYSYTPIGFFLTVLGTVLAATKTVVTNRIQIGRLQLHPLDLLLRMSPLAFVQTVIFSWMKGELDEVVSFCKTEMSLKLVLALLVNGIIAFFLNYVSFTANKKTSALTMTVAGMRRNLLICFIFFVFVIEKDINCTLFHVSFVWKFPSSQRQASVVDRGGRDRVQHDDRIPERLGHYHDTNRRSMLQLCGLAGEKSADASHDPSNATSLATRNRNSL